MNAARPATDPSGRSGVGTAALVATALSALALVVMIVAQLLGIPGFSEGETGSAAGDVAWVTFVLGGMLALILGAVAWIRGRGRRTARGDVRAGQVAVGYVVVALALTLIVGALTA